MSKPRRTIPYSFSLHPKAASIVDNLKDRTKSAQVSTAIVWFWTKGRMMDSEITPRMVSELQERYNEMCIRVMELEQELDKVSSPGEIADNEAKDVPQSRGWRRLLHFFRSFYL